jgi:Asp-tRNA(Asn)/Glu-tRNA(Gln) amidotransferase A subunit family amidase
MSVNGALTRSVEDAALMLDVAAVPFSGDPYYIAPPVEWRASQRLRIGVPWFLLSSYNVDSDCGAAVQSTADACSRLGHEVVTLSSFEGDWAPACEHLSVIWGTQLWLQLQARYRELRKVPDGSGIEPLSWALACLGRQATSADYLSAIRYVHAFGRRLASWFETCDVVLTPVTARRAWPLGELSMSSTEVRAYLTDLFSLCPFTAQFNMAGCPAISVPLYPTVGVQLGAKMGEEALLLNLAQNLLAPDQNFRAI